ncbi:MAG: hypothetical protein EZS28_029416, partial [Streblomastix strix]
MIKNPIKWNKTYQFEDKNRREGWDDNPNDDWTKRTQMQKDASDNRSDRDSTWTEDEVPQHQSVIDTGTAQTASPSQIPKQKGKIGQPPNQDDIDEQEIIQQRLATLQKEKEELCISDSDMEWQQLIGAIDNNNNLTPRIISPAPRMINTGMNKDKSVIQSQLSVTSTQKSQHRSGLRQRQKKSERELELLKAKQQLQQQNNIDINNTNVEIPDIQGTIGQLTGSQPSPIAESLGSNAELRPTEAGSISASNRERTEPQINEGHDDNADEEEDEQTDEAALNQNKDYKVNMNSQLPVQENLGTQPQNNQGLNALSQMEKDDLGPALVGVQEKPKSGRG